jgi:hypothetical protein
VHVADYQADLLWAPPLPQPVLHELPQLRIAGQLAAAGPSPALGGEPLCGEGPVLATGRVGVPAEFAADRGRAARHRDRDRPDPAPGPMQIGDPDPLILGQVPRRDLALHDAKVTARSVVWRER